MVGCGCLKVLINQKPILMNFQPSKALSQVWSCFLSSNFYICLMPIAEKLLVILRLSRETCGGSLGGAIQRYPASWRHQLCGSIGPWLGSPGVALDVLPENTSSLCGDTGEVVGSWSTGYLWWHHSWAWLEQSVHTTREYAKSEWFDRQRHHGTC